MNLTVYEIAQVLGANGSFSDTPVAGFAVDSRLIVDGEVFFCIVGEHSDGHKHVLQASERGAVLIVSEREINSKTAVIVVESTKEALIKIANYYFNKFSAEVVGITGSAGKTTTKELTTQILSTKYVTVGNEGNKNTPIGIPISLKHLTSDTELFVAELSGSHFDELPQLMRIITARVAVVTNVGQTHLERLKDMDGVAKAKGYLISSLPVGGVAILNNDDPRVSQMRELTRCKVVTFGINRKADVSGDLIEDKFIITAGTKTYTVTPKTPTIHFLYDTLSAIAVGLEYGVSLKQSIEVVAKFSPVEGRGRVLKSKQGFSIIDESYNANPVSMRENLKALDRRDGRKFAVLSDMLQMGENTEQIHTSLGEFVSRLSLDGVFCYGELSKHIAHACPGANHYNSIQTLVNTLKTKLRDGDWLLVKGSNSMNMGNIIELLISTES
jgi:UDP-N-acetylmuramoyl-tripeptide--D-alanyl-D-alanine ligase